MRRGRLCRRRRRGRRGEVAEDVAGRVEVRDGVGLVADEVVEAVGGVGVDEAVAYPLAGTDAAQASQHQVYRGCGIKLTFR